MATFTGVVEQAANSNIIMRIKKIPSGQRMLMMIGLGFILALITVFGAKAKITQNANNVGKTKIINDIPGISFEIPEYFLSKATAISEISDISMQSEVTPYVYKNGEDLFFLFCANEYIIIVKKGTVFDFETRETDRVLASTNLNGIYFKTINEKDKIKTKNGRTRLNVIGEVSVTKKLYNDFYGSLEVLNTGETEYSIFAGCLEKYYESNAYLFQYITNSIKQNSVEKEKEISYEVEISTGIVSRTEDKKPIKIENQKPEKDYIETQEENNEIQKTEIQQQEEVKPQSDKNNVKEEAINTNKPEVNVSKPETIVNNPETTEKEEPQNVVSYEKQEVKTSLKSDMAVSSTIYNMLSINTTGACQIINDYTGQQEMTYVKIEEIYNNEYATSLVNEYCRSGKAYYNSFTPPTGTHIEAVKYSVMFTSEESVSLPVKITGLNGENLVYNETKYDMRTYHMKDTEYRNGNWYESFINFYIVPNGCKEYALKFGGYGSNGGEKNSAWFKIIN